MEQEYIPSIMDHPGDQSSPTTLVGSAEATTAVSVEEFVEPHVVFPILIEIKTIVPSIDATSPIIRSGKEMLKTMLDLFRHFAKMHIVAASSWAFNLEVGSIKQVEALERFD